MTWARRLVVVTLVLASAGCSAASPQSDAYTFKAKDSPVQVDSPELRAIKAAAHIEPCPSVSGTEASPGGLPDMTLPCLGGGRSVDLAGLRGPLVLNFWSQTCGPCRDESPLLQSFSSKADGQVHVMGVDFYDPRPAFALGFAKELGITYPQIADPAAATKAALRVVGLPITLFIAPSGRIAYTKVGAIASETELEELVRDHLGVAVPGGAGS